MADPKHLTTPLSDSDLSGLEAGQMVYLSGAVYTARDAAHKRLVEMLAKGEAPPFDFKGQVIYYAGPCPARPGQIIGSVGPTTSGRMDAYSPALIERGLKAMIGKGLRDHKVIEAIVKNGGVYFAAIGGAAALMSQCVKKVEMIAFEDLGTEAVRRLTLENMPVIVAIDAKGRNAYKAM
ncbi:Fe-S-containing hydro-lyase [Deltaproteobacteria bacterium OttesenSCG-928-K17]|nr:Fe-S-containing hydro-lyase [Deltaproteobacteria bacterium OttesenSCG-928-K17]